MGVRASLRNYVSKWLAPVDNRGGWFPLVRDWFSGAWQEGEKIEPDSVATNPTVYSCITLISSDVAKMQPMLQKLSSDDIWVPFKNDKQLLRLLKNPNNYQNHMQFIEWWITSKLFRGNTYVLKVRNTKGQVVQLYILDPERVQVLVTESGDVYYQLQPDNMSGLVASETVPASEIIHDRMCCIFHPLVGVSPLFASALAAQQGLKIQQDSSKFFGNSARPGGLLSAPGQISDATAKRLKDHFDQNYGGANAGKIAVVGDNLKFEPLKMTAVDAQLIDQLNWTDEAICSTFHVPLYKVQKGAIPTSNNVEALTIDYYSQALQPLINSFEICMTQGLELDEEMRIWLDLDALFRMDSTTLIKVLTDSVKGTLMKPNEGRKRLNLPPVEGGDSVYSQQQNFSLAALAERDRNSPLLDSQPAPVAEPAAEPSDNDDSEAESEAAKKLLIAMVTKGLNDAIHAGN